MSSNANTKCQDNTATGNNSKLVLCFDASKANTIKGEGEYKKLIKKLKTLYNVFFISYQTHSLK